MWKYLIPALSLLPPVAAGWLLVAGLQSWRPPASFEDQRQMGNAGRVLNGKITPLGVVAEMESLLAMQRPSVLILGNSYANTNLVPDHLAQGLGVPKNKVLTMSVPNSVSSHWYAILEHRVYEDGYDIPLVIVVAGIQSMLCFEPYSESSYEDLMVQLDSDEPVLRQFIDLDHPELRTVLRNRVQVRDLVMNTVRDTAVSAFFGGGSQATTDAMTRLFSDENLDMARHNAVQPSLADETDDSSVEGLPTADESLVEELAQLAQRNGTTLVFVRPPMKAWTPEDRRDTVTERTEEEVQAILARYGHVYLDMTEIQLPRRAYKNMRHLSPEGAELFTDAVLEEIRPLWRKQQSPRRR
jgi:hypothetical protein